MLAKRNKRQLRTDIHQVGFWYRILRPLVDFATSISFRKVQVLGVEKIPEDGAVIFAPNHCNTLMDALVVLRTRKGPTVFGARADMFNNPVAAKILHFLKIVPMVRKRDGIRKVIRNLDIIEDIIEVLGEGVPFCIFPEGTHRPMHSLLPVGKGVFRIAVSAYKHLDKPVYVVPVGIEYSDYYRYAGTSLVQFGEPVPVTEYEDANPDMLDSEMYRMLTSELKDKMAGLITYIPDDQDYEAKWAYTKIMTAGPRPSSLYERLKKNQQVLADVDVSKLSTCLEFEEARKDAGISYLSLGFKHMGIRTVLKTIGLLLWLPFQLLCGLAALPSILVGEVIVALKVQDKAFANSVRMACTLLVNGITLIVWALVFILSSLSFLRTGIFALFIILFAPQAFYMGLEWYRVWLSDIRLLCHKSIQQRFCSIRSAE